MVVLLYLVARALLWVFAVCAVATAITVWVTLQGVAVLGATVWSLVTREPRTRRMPSLRARPAPQARFSDRR